MSKRTKYDRRKFLKATAAGVAMAGIGFPAIVSAATKTKNAIVLGIDGMDPHLLARFVGEGRMPNAQRLIRAGCLAPLRTTDPPQSPVAWSSFISGTNPGGHGIYDFIARDASTLVPYLSAARLSGEGRSIRVGNWVIPTSAAKMVNLRKGPTFWKELAEHGVDCTVFRVPANFPPTPVKARTLSGLGTPDILGGYGIFTYYTDDKHERTRDVSGGRIERVRIRDHTAECELIGPQNTFDPDGKNVKASFKVHVDPQNRAVLISVQGREYLIQEGEWSDWVEVKFQMLPHLVSVSGICRFYLKKARGPFSLYTTPVNLDPANPSLPISTPEDYSTKLAREVGRFYTQGMAEDTAALSAGVFDDDQYRQQATEVLKERLRFFDHEFNRYKGGFFFFYFSSLDQNSHAFWRAIDPQHPLYTPELAKKHGDFLPWLYSQMDKVIGRAMERLDDRTMLMVMSDHGFAPFRRQFNLNSWLMDNGYATPVNKASRGNVGYFGNVKWSETRAYGLGINGMYLNMRGREPDGIVAPGDREDALARELVAKLTDVRDPQSGDKVVSNVYRRSEIYSGPYVDAAPDLIVCYNRNYRASWDTILGKYPRKQILDNMDPWSGDHALDAAFMHGVFMSNRKIGTARPALADLAPTILHEFGVPAPAGMTGRCLV